MRTTIIGFAVVVACTWGPVVARAQAVYKCTEAGRVTYSHEPCLHAKVVDTTPTQGLDKWSGKSRKGAAVRADETNTQLANALKPLLGETPAQRETRHRRAKLAPEARLECGRLDSELADRAPSAGEGAEALWKARAKYRDLRC